MPRLPLRPGNRLVAFGLQINAGYLAVRVVTLSGEVLAEQISPGDFVSSDPTRTIRALTRLATGLRTTVDERQHTFVGAGLAVPGLVSTDAHRLLLAPNLGWSNVDLTPIAHRLHLEPAELQIGNEADLATRLVATPAPGRHGTRSDFIYLSGETGIGGAAVLQGRLLTGRHGWAGEIGHVCVDPEGPQCPCGSTGCLEQYAGRMAMNRAAGLPTTATREQLAAAVRSGDLAARRAIERAASAISVALASVVNVLDIPVIVLGGHLGVIGDLLVAALEGQLRSRVLSAAWMPPKVEMSERDPAPGAKGAAIHVLERVIDDPDHWIRPNVGIR